MIYVATGCFGNGSGEHDVIGVADHSLLASAAEVALSGVL